MGSQAASLLRKTPARGLRASPDQFSALDRPHPAAQEPRIPAPAIDASRRTSFKSLTGIPVFPPEEGTRTFSSSRLPIQFKLAIGAANDPLEAEADAMAAGVMGMAPNAPASTGTATPVLRRKCSCGGEKCDKCKQEQEGQIQRKAAASVTPREAPPIVHETLRSPGQPLDSSTRSFFEPRFKRDFSSVRVHADDKAAESARSVNALAYTIGPHLVFGPGQYAPSAPAGRELLAHELAHVMQQKEGHTLVQRACKSGAYCATAATLTTFVASTESKPENVAKAARRKKLCGVVPPDPKCTSDGHGAPATALTDILRANFSSRLGYITGIYVNKDMPADYGAVTFACSGFTPPLPGGTCTFVPDVLEAQAKHYQSGAQTIGGSSRATWLTATLGTLTHETEHARFDASAPIAEPSPTACKFVDFSDNLSEMAAHLSEMHVYYRAALARPTADRWKQFDQMFDFWVKNGSEDISGIVKDLRCKCECSDADYYITKTAESVSKSQKWNSYELSVIHTALKDPKWGLDWPVAPPASIDVADLPTTTPAPLKLE